VAFGGQQKPSVRVQVDPAKIASLGIQLEDIASVIATATVDAPKGSINGTHMQVSKKHLAKYAKEFEFRFNCREEPSSMFPALVSEFPQPST